MRVLVTGSRSWPSPQVVFDALDALAPDVVIHGGCPTGADAFAEQWCIRTGTPQDVHMAEWDRHGRRAGYLRNAAMIREQPDLTVAFFHGESKGTRMTVKLALDAGIEVKSYRMD